MQKVARREQSSSKRKDTQTIMNEIKTVSAEAFRTAVFFSLSIRRWGNRAKVKDEAKLQEFLALRNAKDGETPTVQMAIASGNGDMTKTTKMLVTSEKLDALNRFLNETKASLCGPFGKANPSRIKDGLFVVSKALVQEFEDKLSAALKEMRDVHLPAFMADYLPAKERAKTMPVKQGGLGPIYNENDYPLSGDLEEMFGLEWQWLALGVPEDLPATLRAQAAEKLEKQFTEAAEEVKDALRISFSELIAHAVDKLTPNEDGKMKVFRDSTITNVQDFLDVFSARNIMQDGELEALVTKAQEVLIGIDVKGIRKDQSVRDEARQQFEAIKAALDPMVEVKRSRKFDLE